MNDTQKVNNTVPAIIGAPVSQPVRAVLWLAMIKELEFDFKFPAAPSFVTNDKFKELNPLGFIPVLTDGDFVLYEMPAILYYLCDKYGYNDFYPTDLKQRAVINQYMSAHMTFTRQSTLYLMGPHVHTALGEHSGQVEDRVAAVEPDVYMSTKERVDMLERGQRIFGRVADIIDSTYLADGSPYLFGHNNPTIADLACYQELAQLDFAKLFDFGPYKNIVNWLAAMRSLPHHDAVMAYNIALGDIRTPELTLERFMAAGAAGGEALAAAGVPAIPLPLD